MDKYLSRLSDRLHTIFFENEDLNHVELVYKTFVTDKNEDFDKKYYNLFLEEIAYLYSRNHKLSEIVGDKVPFINSPIIESDISFVDFRMYIRNLIGLEVSSTDDVVVEKEDCYDYTLNAVANNLLKEEGFWNKVNSEVIDSKEKEDKEVARLFVPVDNSNLYLFATLLLSSMEEQNLDYSFKVNTNPSVQLGNNVEINVSQKNYETVLGIINKIKTDYPQIKINNNQLPILSYPVSDDVGIVPIINDALFEEKLAMRIIELKHETRNFNQLLEETYNFTKDYFSLIENLTGKLPDIDDNKLL